VSRQGEGIDECPVARGRRWRQLVQRFDKLDEGFALGVGLLLPEMQAVETVCECICGRDKSFDERAGPALPLGFGIAIAAQELRQIAEELEPAPLICDHELRHDAVVVLADEMRPQPGLVMLIKCNVGLARIDDLGPGIDIGFGGIRLDQLLREAVNGRAGELVDGLARPLHVRLLRGGEALGKGKRNLVRNLAARERIDIARDALEELACGKLGKRHRGNVHWLDPIGEQDRDATRHERGLARARACLHQQGSIDRGERGRTRRRIGKPPFHASSQISAAAPSCSRAGSRFRSR